MNDKSCDMLDNKTKNGAGRGARDDEKGNAKRSVESSAMGNDTNDAKGRIGVIKEINSIGRIVIPKEYRDRLKLEKSVELVITEEGVLIRNSEYRLVKAKKTDSE